MECNSKPIAAAKQPANPLHCGKRKKASRPSLMDYSQAPLAFNPSDDFHCHICNGSKQMIWEFKHLWKKNTYTANNHVQGPVRGWIDGRTHSLVLSRETLGGGQSQA